MKEVQESCRRSCGGHAFSAHNAIHGLTGYYDVITTGGGDNVVLMQLLARYLLLALRKAKAGHEVQGSAEYMNAHARYSSVAKSGF